MKDGKKSKKMKKVIIWEARQALLGGWKFIIRLIWRERSSHLPSVARGSARGDPTQAMSSPCPLPRSNRHQVTRDWAKLMGSNVGLTHIFGVKHDEKSNHLDKGQQRAEEDSNPAVERG